MRKLAILMMICGFLAGCGVKPSQVDPPEGKGSSEFPRTYPDLATDPAPEK